MHKYELLKNHQNPQVDVSKVAIVGARGYAGAELARILLKHPRAKLVACFAGTQSFDLEDLLPEEAAASVTVATIDEMDRHLEGVHSVFLATPTETSIDLAGRILKSSSAHVIDLSGAFRLDETEAKQWYGVDDAKLLSQADYGLIPWCGPKKSSRLISNPGCYATSVLMAILPLLKSGLIDPHSLVIDAKSGASGAGKKAAENLLFCEVEGECFPYRVGKHQHLPEIVRFAKMFADTSIDPMFTTHLLPVRRGILSSIYARTSKTISHEDVQAAYDEAYAGYSLVRHGLAQDSDRSRLSLRRAVGSARTEIRYLLNGDKLHVFSLIDNLMKGAASQAVENYNRILDLPVTTGLTECEGVL